MKKICSKIIFLLVLNIISGITIAQQNFIEGYIINLSGEKIEGLIDYKNWDKNPKTISFKKTIESETKEFNPKDIKRFFVSNELYIAANVILDESPQRTEDLIFSIVEEFVEGKVFLFTLFESEKSLFYYKSQNGNEHFIINRDTIYEELILKKHFKYVDNRIKIIASKRFVGQLNYYLNDCPSIKNKIINTDLKKTSLQRLFNAYYKCKNPEFIYKSSKEKIEYEFGVNTGLNISKIKFFSEFGFSSLTEIVFPVSYNYAVGLFYAFSIPRTNRKLFFNNELQYVQYQTQAAYDDYSDYSEVLISTTTSYFDFQYLRLNSMLKYKISINKTSIYINGGITNGFAIKSYNHYIKENYLYNTINLEGTILDVTPKYQDYRIYEQSFLAGLTIKYKPISLDFRYEISNGMSKFSGLKTPVTRYFILLGYSF